MNHNINCKCFAGHHIWDVEYSKVNKSEQYCICCYHIFPFDDEEAATNSIEWADDGLLNKSTTKSNQTGGFSKGKIVRR